MFIESAGTLVRKGVEIVDQYGAVTSWPSWGSSVLGERWGTYGEIYRTQLWVAVLVNKIARAQARLPLKVYRRAADDGREEARDHPYARLLRNPSSRHDPFTFYEWTFATELVFGSAMWGKIRDAGGRPVELVLLHPSAMKPRVDRETGVRSWDFDNGRVRIEAIPDYDVVHFHTYHPDDPDRGLSPLEPLRATLENEAAAREATSSFWRNGARPGVALMHPAALSQEAQTRLRVQWDALSAGADKTGKTVVLEEGMKAEKLTLTAEEAQYIESRKLNREECCAAYDMPPPAVHILDRATFSNITEQMRSLYRDTMAPRLADTESTLEFGLRGSRRPGASEPDFGDDVYAEYLLDEVLRGDFEASMDAAQKAVNSAQMTPNEARRLRNLPPMPGGDVLLVNSTLIPLEAAAAPAAAGGEESAPAAGPAAPAVRHLERVAPRQLLGPLPADQVRAVMGRLSRPTHPRQVEPRALVEGLNGHGKAVLAALTDALTAGDDMPALRDRIRALGKERA